MKIVQILMNNERFSFVSFRSLCASLLVVLWMVAACSSASEPTPQPTPTLAASTPPDGIATKAAMQPPALDENLLTAEGVTVQCDASQPETLDCQTAQLPHRVEAAINASIFARWSMRLPAEMPTLTGREVLAITLRTEGTLRPNLYFV